MNKNPESKTSAEDLSQCINPKSKQKTEKDIYWERQREIIKEVFEE